MLRRNIIVVGKDEETMQGLIRGIEAIDKENQLSIIHGVNEPSTITEALWIIADLAEAIVVADADSTIPQLEQHVSQVYFIPLLTEYTTREEVIEHIKKFPYLIQNILNA